MERMAIGQALGMKQWTLEEEIKMVKWNPNGEDCVLPLYDAIHTPFLEVCEGPYTLDTRHLTEDIPYGLVTYSSLGKMLGVPTPVTDAIISLSEVLLQKDFRRRRPDGGVAGNQSLVVAQEAGEVSARRDGLK